MQAFEGADQEVCTTCYHVYQHLKANFYKVREEVPVIEEVTFEQQSEFTSDDPNQRDSTVEGTTSGGFNNRESQWKLPSGHGLSDIEQHPFVRQMSIKMTELQGQVEELKAEKK